MPGPELPPEFKEDAIVEEKKEEPKTVIAGKVDDKDKSELKSSIKKKGQNSYYYAHNYDG